MGRSVPGELSLHALFMRVPGELRHTCARAAEMESTCLRSVGHSLALPSVRPRKATAGDLGDCRRDCETTSEG